MSSFTLAAAVAATSLALAGCTGGDQRDANQALSQLTKAATQMAEQAQQVAGGAAGSLGQDAKPVPPVSFKTLIDYLPKELGGMKASEPEGETTTAGEWQYSQANVRFTGVEGRSAEAGVSDFAHISMLYLPFQMALKMKVSQESTRGYSRSIDFDGFPALEEWNKDDKRSELTVLVADRFVVSAKMRGGEEGAARQIVEKMDLKGLAKESTN
jgi:hypothetical protein